MFKNQIQLQGLFFLLMIHIPSVGNTGSSVCFLNNTGHLGENSKTYIIQAGSFKSKSNALKYQHRLQQITQYPVSIHHNIYYKVHVGPVDTASKTKEVAQHILAQLHHPTTRIAAPHPTPIKTIAEPQPIVALHSENQHWFVTAGGGAQWSQSKSSMTVHNGSQYPYPQNVDLFTVQDHSTGGMFFLSAGHRWERDNTWLSAYSLGLYYQYLFNHNINGTITQYSDPEFLNYSYQWGNSSNLILISNKLNIYQVKKWSPYVSLGLGVALNRSGTYTETAYTNVTPRYSPDYASSTSSNFAYQLGLGIDYQATPSWILGLGYLYQNLGTSESGPGASTWSSTRLNLGSLSQNELALSVTYLR